MDATDMSGIGNSLDLRCGTKSTPPNLLIVLITNGHVGYMTLYRQPDGTYDLFSTKKVGNPLIPWGKCFRAPRNSDYFICSSGLVIRTGKHIVTCVGLLVRQMMQAG